MECIRCGSCKTTCPTYEIRQNETETARGRIAILKALLSGRIEPMQGAVDAVFGCIQCGACTGNCAPGIDIQELLYRGKAHLKKYAKKDRMFRRMTQISLHHRDLLLRIARMLQTPVHAYLCRKNILPDTLPLPKETLKQLPQVVSPRKKIGRVAVFKGCSTGYLFPHLGSALMRILLHLGFEVVLPRAEVCCGAPFRTLGMEKTAKTLARKNLEIFGKLQVDAIISLCPTCVMAFRKEYPKLIHAGIENVVDIASFLTTKTIRLVDTTDESAFYHDPCHMLYGLNVVDEPRELLKKSGITLKETPHSCCGFGGTYSLKFRGDSLKLAGKRKDAIEGLSVNTVYTSCPGCMLQLKKVLPFMKVLHLVEAVDKALVS